MPRVARARLTRQPLAVLVPEQGQVAAFRLVATAGQDEEMLLWEAQSRFAYLAGEIPEEIRLVVFRDVSVAPCGGGPQR